MMHHDTTIKKELQKFKGLHELRLCDMCARDVHNLTKKAQVRQWGGCPSSFLPSHHFFLPPFSPSLFQPLSVHQMQGFVSVPNRWSIIPPQKCSKPAARPFTKTNQTRGRDAENERQQWRRRIYVKDSEYLKSCVHLHMSKCGWGGLNWSPSLLSWEPRLSVTQTTSYTWLASVLVNTDAIKPTLMFGQHILAGFQSVKCVWHSNGGERSCELCTLQSSVCLTHTVSLAPIKLSAGPLYPNMPSPCDMHFWVNINSYS